MWLLTPCKPPHPDTRTNACLRCVLSFHTALGNRHRYDGSNVGAASPTQPNKVWWTQAEALLGFEFLDKQTGNAGYKTKLQQTLGFITQHLQDKQYGEWYWQTASAGGAPLSFNAGDVQWPATTKGLAWKASYHTGRSALRLVQAGY